MGKKRKSKEPPTEEPVGFTLGDMLRAKGITLSKDGLPEGPPANQVGTEPQGEIAGPTTTLGLDIRLKIERKGRRRKTVTLIEGLALDGEELAAFTKSLRKAMGAGAKVEGDRVVVQGDIRDRLVTWLEKSGAGSVRCV